MPAIVLQTEDLTKRYGDLTAVDDLSLQVYEGEVLGFLGPNGAGKTTSINMMCGLLKPDSGRVILHGKPIGERDRGMRTRIGMCPQDIVLWERLTCIEQLQFIGQMYGLSGKKARQRGESLLEEMDLVEKRKVQARKLSGGMQRRLNLAMALVHDQVLLENIRCGDGTVHSMRGGESVVTYQGVASLSPSQGFHPRCAPVAYVHCVSYEPRPIA